MCYLGILFGHHCQRDQTVMTWHVVSMPIAHSGGHCFVLPSGSNGLRIFIRRRRGVLRCVRG